MSWNESGTLKPTSLSAERWWWIGLLAVIVLGAYFGSGFYVVNADEHAVVRRFGAIAARVGDRSSWPNAKKSKAAPRSTCIASIG